MWPVVTMLKITIPVSVDVESEERDKNLRLCTNILDITS